MDEILIQQAQAYARRHNLRLAERLATASTVLFTGQNATLNLGCRDQSASIAGRVRTRAQRISSVEGSQRRGNSRVQSSCIPHRDFSRPSRCEYNLVVFFG